MKSVIFVLMMVTSFTAMANGTVVKQDDCAEQNQTVMLEKQKKSLRDENNPPNGRADMVLRRAVIKLENCLALSTTVEK